MPRKRKWDWNAALVAWSIGGIVAVLPMLNPGAAFDWRSALSAILAAVLVDLRNWSKQ